MSVDLATPLFLIVIFSILFFACTWCCKKTQEGVVFQNGTTSHVYVQQPNNSTVPPAGAGPAYPAVPAHPMPYAGAPAPGFATPLPAAPYPPQSAMPQPYGQQGGAGPVGTAPYPPYPAEQQIRPPSYDDVMRQQPDPAVDELKYAKQAPYNPNY